MRIYASSRDVPVVGVIGFCGAFPYLSHKEDCLTSRGLLRPAVWSAVYRLATDPAATVTRVGTAKSPRVEIVSHGTTVVLVDAFGIGLPVVLTAYYCQDPRDHGAEVLAAASKVDAHRLVDLDARLWGHA